MKKILALLLTFILIFTFTISVSAVVSPKPDNYLDVYINRTGDGESSDPCEHVAVPEGDTLTITPSDDSDREFISWNFYDDDMKPAKPGVDFIIVQVIKEDGTPAEEGVDYTVKNGRIITKKGELISVVVKPISNPLYISEYFKGADIEFNTPDGETISPATGENINLYVVIALSTVILAAGATMIITGKKAFAKN